MRDEDCCHRIVAACNLVEVYLRFRGASCLIITHFFDCGDSRNL
jgi:hypothetical protein